MPSSRSREIKEGRTNLKTIDDQESTARTATVGHQGIEIMTAPVAMIQGEENVHGPGSAGAMRGTKCCYLAERFSSALGR
jgi:hypothetical protein